MSSFVSYLRRYRDPHGALGMLGPACRRVGTVQLVRVPMHPVLADVAPLPRRASGMLGKLFGHLRLIPRAWMAGGRTLFIREFLTVPLFLVAPALWLRRRSLWFLCHHNVGQAARHPVHRLMLRILYAVGFRFVVYETIDTWRPVAAHPDPSRIIAMPTPIPELARSAPVRDPVGRKMVVGFIGSFRAEKSPRWALEAIAGASAEGRFTPPIELLVGTADADFLERWKDRASVVNTTLRADYLRALESCDVVVLPYDESAYNYRISGVLAEAVGLGCLVVAPDLPALRDQVGLPLPAGACYRDRAELVECVQRAVDMARQPARAEAVQAHREHRSMDAVTRAIARMGAAA
jgi:glycosyltransferase involved in cell wall biosynthesis